MLTWDHFHTAKKVKPIPREEITTLYINPKPSLPSEREINLRLLQVINPRTNKLLSRKTVSQKTRMA